MRTAARTRADDRALIRCEHGAVAGGIHNRRAACERDATSVARSSAIAAPMLVKRFMASLFCSEDALRKRCWACTDSFGKGRYATVPHKKSEFVKRRWKSPAAIRHIQYGDLHRDDVPVFNV